MSGSADAWVTPAQMAALHPTATQVLYRFGPAPTGAQVAAGVDRVTARLPAGAVSATQSYLTLKQSFSAPADSYLPFITVFGVLGLVVSVVIVGNVVSGAVVAGAITAGSAPRAGRGPWLQRRLAGTRLSRPVSLGLRRWSPTRGGPRSPLW